jgi:hypothetical protein
MEALADLVHKQDQLYRVSWNEHCSVVVEAKSYEEAKQRGRSKGAKHRVELQETIKAEKISLKEAIEEGD